MYLKHFSTFNYYTKRGGFYLYLQMIYHISTITQGTSLLPELPDSQSHSASIHPTPIYWSHLPKEKRSARVIPLLKTLQELPFIYGTNSKILPTIWNYSTNTCPFQFVPPLKTPHYHFHSMLLCMPSFYHYPPKQWPLKTCPFTLQDFHPTPSPLRNVPRGEFEISHSHTAYFHILAKLCQVWELLMYGFFFQRFNRR